MTKTVAVLLLALASCSKSSDTGLRATGASAPPGVASARDARALLSDDKAVAGFAAYKKEMAPHAKEAMEIFSAAHNRAGSDAKKTDEAVKEDPRMAAYLKLNEAALAKAGMTESEMRAMTSALSNYTSKLYVVREAERQKAALEKRHAAGEEPAPGDEITAKMAAEAAAKLKPAQEEFVKLYGPAALDVVHKHADELIEAQDAALKGMLGK
jgi:hypothetical protein